MKQQRSKSSNKLVTVLPRGVSGYLGQKGYTISKSALSPEHLVQLKEMLTVQPMIMGGKLLVNSSTFPIYRESVNKMYMPRYFGIQHFGPPTEIQLSPGDTIDVPFRGSLRDHQIPAVDAYLHHTAQTAHAGGLLELNCAAGKCLGRDTLVLMFDGSLRKVQDIRVGELLMGDDCTPRRVLSLAHGHETLYRINGPHGESYVVNRSHILSLKRGHGHDHDQVVDIPLLEYLSNVENLRGYRVPIIFPRRTIPMNAYDAGHWYGSFTANKENSVRMLEIPSEYIINCPEIQQQFIAGIMESSLCTYCETTSTYQLSHDHLPLMEQLFYLMRSLGMVVWKKKDDDITTPTTTTIIVSKNKDLTYPVHVQCIDNGEYFGFCLDGNRRFVLGDFSVTHNTVMSLNIISQLKTKTLIIVNKEFLLNQWIERIQEFLPTARVGRIQGPIIDITSKDIVIGMLQSLSMKDYPSSTFQSFGLTVLDEVHHISSEVFSAALFKIVTKYMLGLSATMERKDGTTPVIKMFLGDVVYQGTSNETHDVMVRAIEYRTRDTGFQETEYDFRGNPQYSKMIVKLCDFVPRCEFIVRTVHDLVLEKPTTQIMILGHNRSLLTYLHDRIAQQGFATAGYYVGGMKQSALQETEKKQIVIATYSMAAEALDIKTLSTLVIVTPKTDIIQSVGRILRTKHSQPLIVDIVDMHTLFQNQWKKRRAYYKKCNYHIYMTDSDSYTNMIDTHTWRRVYQAKDVGDKGEDTPKCLIDIQETFGDDEKIE